MLLRAVHPNTTQLHNEAEGRYGQTHGKLLYAMAMLVIRTVVVQLSLLTGIARGASFLL
ncbi:MAG: hypothetical protein ACJ72H_28920 [Candidatus Sulfotelmatobacter sp.]